MGIAKTRLLAHSLVHWPNWNIDIEKICSECVTCKENQQMPANIPKFQVSAKGPGEVYGCDITDINGKQHFILVDYFSCCIFERKLENLTSFCVIEALKDIFCDLGSPDKLITDNACYFVSEEFVKFTMDWSIQHVTSSPRFPHGNAHAKKAVGIMKQIYERCQDVKLGLLLLKTMSITNPGRDQSHTAPCNSFYGCTLKAHLPVYQSISAENTCTLDAENSAQIEIGDIPSKYYVDQDVWVKVDPHTKWMAGKISQILPNQSYVVELTDGHVFHRNQHHITKWQSCLKPSINSEVTSESHSYNLRPRKSVKHVQWPNYPTEVKQGEANFDIEGL